MDVRRTNSINLDNDFAKDFLQISRKVTLGFVLKVRDGSFFRCYSQIGGDATSSKDFSLDHGPARNPPPPPFIKGGLWGDFREGSAKQDFLADFKIFHFDRPHDESRTFRTKPDFLA